MDATICGDTRALTDAVALPADPALAARVALLRSLPRAVAEVDEQGLGYPPALGLRRGMLSEAGQHHDAEATLTRALPSRCRPSCSAPTPRACIMCSARSVTSRSPLRRRRGQLPRASPARPGLRLP